MAADKKQEAAVIQRRNDEGQQRDTRDLTLSDVKTLAAVDDKVYEKCQKYDHGAYRIEFGKTTVTDSDRGRAIITNNAKNNEFDVQFGDEVVRYKPRRVLELAD
ncbi:unnamed protein product, partial [Laminaria digitata]